MVAFDMFSCVVSEPSVMLFARLLNRGGHFHVLQVERDLDVRVQRRMSGLFVPDVRAEVPADMADALTQAEEELLVQKRSEYQADLAVLGEVGPSC